MRFHMTLSPLCLALALGVAAPDAVAQQPRPDSASIANAVRTLKSDLRNYVTAQETFYSVHSTYAGTADATTLKPSAGVTVIVLTFSPQGHNAVAIHKDAPGLVCGIWVGQQHAPPLNDRAGEGEPTCRLPH